MTAPTMAAPAHRTLKTERLVLRPLEVSDAEALFPVFSDPVSMRYWSCLPHKDVAETTAMLRGMVGTDDGTSRMWAVTTDGGRCLGWSSLFGVRNRLGELGYILTPEARGRGYATEAVGAALAFGFGEWNLHRVAANLDPRNDRSAALLERLGFTREAVTRKDFLVGGIYYDSMIYGLLADEWSGTVERPAHAPLPAWTRRRSPALEHVSVGTSDLARAGAFYDKVLANLGLGRLFEGHDHIAWGRRGEGFFIVNTPLDTSRPAGPGNGSHVCFGAPTRAAVDAFHRTALEHGAADDGAPGLRPHYTPTYYAAFVLDPDGHKIEAVCHLPEAC
ncbi:MAG TPA: GNAT family N-acetyltransferase [Azospirillaceae bacterium]|nr:GNAT family N-acetyltransferase [Azospirillaceae bacterium]